MRPALPPDAGLTFSWNPRQGFPFVLFGCAFLSLVAHIATFFLFQVIPPQRVTIPPPAPQIEVLTPATPEGAALLRWIDAEDPALVASTHAVSPPGLLEVPYRPSFAVSRTAPRGSVESPVIVQFPPARDALAIVQSALPSAEPDTRTAVATPSGVTFSGALRGRALATAPIFIWKNRVATPAEPLRAMLGVSDRGEVRYIFQQQSSGQPALDTEALAQLQRFEFTRADEPLAWGFATVTFGLEAYATASAQPAISSQQAATPHPQ